LLLSIKKVVGNQEQIALTLIAAFSALALVEEFLL
jgi:hypothetical protein